jgi:hypothetical protein
MAWYYYNGDSILSVSIGNGEVVAVRPHSTIFVDATAENSAAFKRFGRVLRRTGAPKDAKSLVPAQPIAGKVTVAENSFSASIVEGSKAVAAGEDSPLVKALQKPVVVAEVSDAAESDSADQVEVEETTSEEPTAAPARKRRVFAAKTEID